MARPALALVAGLAIERFVELRLSRARLRGNLGAAAGSDLEWRAMILVHAALLLAPLAEASLLGTRSAPALLWTAIAGALAAQGLRYWSVCSLGRAWNARAVVDPALGFVERGPYRWIRHPNYLAVLVEFTAIPLAFGAWRSWIVLNLLHVPLIMRRIRAEERLLARVPGYEARMGAKGRLLPRRRRRPV